MAAFYCGTGATDIADTIPFLSISGGKSWEISFSNHSPKMCDPISSVDSGVISRKLKGKIESMIRDIFLESKYSNTKLKKQQLHYLRVTPQKNLI